MTQRLIDAKLYDTDTAKKVAETCNGLNCGDFGREWRGLYLTQSGAWFLHLETHTEDLIIPHTDDDAFEFLQDHSSDPEIFTATMEHFRERITDA